MVWPQAGPENTLGTLKIAIEAAGRHGIRHLVIASNSGATVRKALEIGAGDISVVCVTHHVGFSGPGVDEMPQEVRRDLTSPHVELRSSPRRTSSRGWIGRSGSSSEACTRRR